MNARTSHAQRFIDDVDIPKDLVEFIPGFLERRQKEISQFRLFLQESDFIALSVMGHKLKGTGTSYGFTSISLIGTEIENAAAKKDVALLDELADEYADLIFEIKRKLEL